MKTNIEILLKNGILLVDFNSSSLYDAVIKSMNDARREAIAEHEAWQIKTMLSMKTFGDRTSESVRNDIIDGVIMTITKPLTYQEGGEG